MATEERVFWRGGTCSVWVRLDDDGALEFCGQELSYMGESGRTYEYWVTVPPSQFPKLRQALGADGPTDMVDLVCSRVDAIMPRGERAFLDERGIEYRFNCY